jgi:hypothetical protein
LLFTSAKSLFAASVAILVAAGFPPQRVAEETACVLTHSTSVAPEGYPHPFINLFEIAGERIFSLILAPIFIGTPR